MTLGSIPNTGKNKTVNAQREKKGPVSYGNVLNRQTQETETRLDQLKLPRPRGEGRMESDCLKWIQDYL